MKHQNIIMKTIKKTRYLILLLALFCFTTPSFSTIFYSKNEAMELAFGKDAQVETLSLFPDKNETAQIETLAKVKMESGMFSFYVGKKQGKILGYAAIETETVRTKPETLMILLTPEGAIRSVTLLAFHEPPEYQAPERWFEQFTNKPLDELDFNKGIQGISGATLSTRSALNSVRKVMAVYQVMIKNKGKK
jgi:Na+-translocating ferredoxin:NAD+ oxidoreductase RnfG subunit